RPDGGTICRGLGGCGTGASTVVTAADCRSATAGTGASTAVVRAAPGSGGTGASTVVPRAALCCRDLGTGAAAVFPPVACSGGLGTGASAVLTPPASCSGGIGASTVVTRATTDSGTTGPRSDGTFLAWPPRPCPRGEATGQGGPEG